VRIKDMNIGRRRWCRASIRTSSSASLWTTTRDRQRECGSCLKKLSSSTRHCSCRAPSHLSSSGFCSCYEFDKSTVLGAFNALRETRELQFQDEPALEQALGLYGEGSADFADCLHAGQCGSAGRISMISFEAIAARLANGALLKT
jgi:hypothetical protein